VTDSAADMLVRIDPATRAVRDTIRVGRAPAGVAVGAGSVWVTDSGDGTVSRIDPATDRVQARILVGGSPQAVTVAAGRAWVTVDARSLPAAGGRTLRMVTSDDLDVLDPALTYDEMTDQLVSATCAGLVYQPDGAGSEPAPEVAQALPVRSAGGRTYAFRIRRGFRFSPPDRRAVPPRGRGPQDRRHGARQLPRLTVAAVGRTRAADPPRRASMSRDQPAGGAWGSRTKISAARSGSMWLALMKAMTVRPARSSIAAMQSALMASW
jgi:YVTN family beta-propeller protein